MSGISLNLPEDLSNSLADLAKTNGQSASYLAMDVLRDYIEHEKALTTHIEGEVGAILLSQHALPFPDKLCHPPR